MYKTIIFDFFGVIAQDPYSTWLEKNGYERKGEFLSIVQAVDKGEITINEYYNRLHSTSGRSIGSLQKEFEDDVVPNKNIIKLIKQLKTNYQIGLLTNSPHSSRS